MDCQSVLKSAYLTHNYLMSRHILLFFTVATALLPLSCKDQASDSSVSTPAPALVEQPLPTKSVYEIANEFVDSMHGLPAVLATMNDDASTTEGIVKMKKLLDESKAIMDQLHGLEPPSNEERTALDKEMTEKSRKDARAIFSLLMERKFKLSPKALAELEAGMTYFETTMTSITPAVEKYFKPDATPTPAPTSTSE